MDRVQLVRLLAECFAVLELDQIDAMAASMDRDPREVEAMLKANEQEWEALKASL